jgi:hypothetical protein
MLFKIVIGANLESPEYLSISPLYLVIASGVCHRSEAEVFLKVPALELDPIVGDDSVRVSDDSVRDSELAHN